MKGYSLIKKIVIFLFIVIWIFPLFIFMKDFFNLSSLSILREKKTFFILKNTCLQAGVSTLVSFIISLFPAYYISRKNNKLAELLKNSIFIPFFFPPISAVMAFSIIFLIIKRSFGIQLSYSLLAIIIGHSFYNSPIFVKYLGEALKRIDESYIEEAKISGADNFMIFFKIELPMVIHSFFKSALLVFMYSFTSFVVVLSLGNIKYSSFELSIAQTLMNELNFSKALAYSIVQMGVLFFFNYILYRETIFETGNIEREEKNLSFYFTFFSLLYVLFEYGVMLTGLIAGFFNYQTYKFDFSYFIKIFTKSFNADYPILKSIVNSVILAAIVSLVVVMIAYFILRIGKKTTEILIMSSMGFSSVFIALCLYYLNILYGINLKVLLFIGFMQSALPLAYSFLHKHVKGFDKSLIEAAKIDRANSIEIFYYIEFKILKPIFINVFLQIFAIVYSEFTIAYTMQIGEVFPMVSIVNYSLLSRKFVMESAAFSSINILVVYIVYYFSKWRSEEL